MRFCGLRIFVQQVHGFDSGVLIFVFGCWDVERSFIVDCCVRQVVKHLRTFRHVNNLLAQNITRNIYFPIDL